MMDFPSEYYNGEGYPARKAFMDVGVRLVIKS